MIQGDFEHVLSLAPEQVSCYALRHSGRGDHFCTAEVAAMCLELTGDAHAALTLDAYLDVFIHHYLQAKHQLPPQYEGEAHQRLRALARIQPINAVPAVPQGSRCSSVYRE